MKSTLVAVAIVCWIALMMTAGCTGKGVQETPAADTPAAAAGPETGDPTTPAAATSPAEAPGPFSCEYDEDLLMTSPEFSRWFNASCYYNTYCGWWEAVDLQPTARDTTDCTNCSTGAVAWSGPTPAHTPCPVRTPRPAASITSAPPASSGSCGAGLTECRVFSTDYCVDLMTDVKHCGACRYGCYLRNANNGCRNGECFVESCLAGWADCNGNDEDGCETDLDSDDRNCGKCGRVCSLPNAHAICTGEDGNGRCEVEYCLSGWVNSNGIHEDGCEVQP